MKKLIKIMVVLILLPVIAAALHPLWMGALVAKIASAVAPGYTGGEVAVESCSVNLFAGRVEIGGLRVANPPGYGPKDAVAVKRVKVQVDPASLFSDTIAVKEVILEAPEVSYCFSGGTNNFEAIGNNAKRKADATDDDGAEEMEEAVEDAAEQKVTVDLLSITGGVVRFEKLPIPVPALTLKDIGKKSGGATLEDVVEQTWEAIKGSATGIGEMAKGVTNDVMKAVGEAGTMLGEGAQKGVKEVNEVLKESGKKAGEALKSLGKSLLGN